MGVAHGSPTQLSNDDPYVRWTQFTPDHAGVSCQQIAETTVDSPVASITFSNITDIYRTLMLDIAARSDEVDTADTLRVRLNGDTGSNYDYVYDFQSGVGQGGGEAYGTTSMFLGFATGSLAPANEAGAGRFLIVDYSRSQWNRSILGHNTVKIATTSGNHYTYIFSGRWRSTAVVTSITIFAAVGNFEVGSTFTLWGMV